jgi:hypothetical protein
MLTLFSQARYEKVNGPVSETNETGPCTGLAERRPIIPTPTNATNHRFTMIRLTV